MRPAIVDMCMRYHQHTKTLAEGFLEETGRITYVTPTSYLELLGAFRSLLDVKRTESSTAKSRYDVGLRKLNDTAESVAGMQE